MVNFNGIDYAMDVAVCEHALVRGQVEGRFHSMESLGAAAGVSRSSVSRFFGGRPVSLRVALAILARLRLRFDDVYQRGSPNDRDGAVVELADGASRH